MSLRFRPRVKKRPAKRKLNGECLAEEEYRVNLLVVVTYKLLQNAPTQENYEDRIDRLCIRISMCITAAELGVHGYTKRKKR